MSKTSGNLQNELAAKDDEINKLSKRLQELERDLIKVRKEKDDEIERRDKEKA